MIQVCLSVHAAKEFIPHLLHKSRRSTSSHERIAGVVLGGGFDQKDLDQIRESIKNHSSTESASHESLPITWLRNDLKIKYHNNPFLPEKQELYGQEVGQRAKKRLLDLLKEGKLQSPKDQVYLF